MNTDKLPEKLFLNGIRKAAPLGLSKALQDIRLEWGRLCAAREALRGSNDPASRRKRGDIALKIAKLRRKDFQLRQMCFQWGLSVTSPTSEDL